MPAPNPIWGLHVTPGAAAWVKLRRDGDLAYRVLEWSTEALPATASEAVTAASTAMERRGVRGYGVYLALPDDSGSLVTARLTSDELDLQGEDLTRELHEHTPFEHDAAVLRMRYLRTDGRRRVFLVSALPVAQERQFEAATAARRDGSLALGFASSATWRGAIALGVARAPSFLVEIHAHTSVVFAFDATRVRRYFIACGVGDAREDPARLEALGQDIRNVAEYHQKLAYGSDSPPADLPTPILFASGVALADPVFRAQLCVHLGTEFATFGGGARGDAAPVALDGTAPPPAAEAPESATRVTFEKEPGEVKVALIGAVGAALLAFESNELGMSICPLAADLPTPDEGGGTAQRLALTAAALALAAGAVWWFGFRGEGGTTKSGGPNSVGPNGVSPGIPNPTGTGETPTSTGAGGDPAAQTTLDLTGPFADLTRRATFADALADASAVLSRSGWIEASLELRWDAGGYSAKLTAAQAPGSTVRVPVDEILNGRLSRESPAQVAFDNAGAAPRVSATWKRVARAAPDPAVLSDDEKSRGAHLLTEALNSHAARPPGQTPRSGVFSSAIPAAEPLATILAWSPVGGPSEMKWSGATVEFTDAFPTRTPPSMTGRVGDATSIGGILDRLSAPLPGRLQAPPTAMMEAKVEPISDSSVRIVWGDGPADRRLMIRRTSPDGTVGAWSEVQVLPMAADSRDEWLADAGTYTLRVETATAKGPERSFVVAPAITAEPQYLLPGGGVRFQLSRRWRGSVLTASADAAPGAPIRGRASSGSEAVAFELGETLSAARIVDTTEKVDVRVPRFAPDGKVLRDGAGAPVMAVIAVDRPVRTLEADLAGPSGELRKVSKKMTDG